MTIQVLTIPDNPDEIPRWLENQLMGLHLPDLIAELKAIFPASTATPTSLDEVLGQQRVEVLQLGLRNLSRVQLRALMHQADLLHELQLLVLEEGGNYWVNRPMPPELDRLLSSTWETIQHTQQVNRPRQRFPWRTTLAIAAMLLMGVLLTDYVRRVYISPSPEFAWTQPKLWPKENRIVYLNYLADEAESYWQESKAFSASRLAVCLGDLRTGCSVLLVQNHSPLTAEEKTWLHEKCQLWSQKLDTQRERLEQEGEVVATEVRANVSEIVNKLASALREKA